MNEILSNKLIQISDQITNMIVAKTPAALGLMLMTARIDAISNILQSLSGLLLIALLVVGWFKLAKHIISKTDDFDGYRVLFEVVSLIGGFGATIFLIFCVITIADVFNWVGIWWPQIYLAHQVMGKVLGGG